MKEMLLQSLVLEDPLEKEMAPVFLPGKSCGQVSLMGYSPVHGGHTRVIYNLATKKQQTVKRRHH